MAQAAGTYDTYDVGAAGGNREDLIDSIFDITPTDCPLTMAIGRSIAKSTKHEWQIDALAAPTANNAAIEGDEFTYADPDPTDRIINYTQILRKTIKVSGSQEKTDKAGRNSEMGYQAMKRNKEIKRDLESSLTSNNASVVGTSSVARKLGGIRAWLTTNTSLGATGADGGFQVGTGLVDAATDGTPRALTKSLLDSVIASCFTEGAELKLFMVGPFNKQAFSDFMADTDVAQLRTNVTGDGLTTIIGGVDVYKSDFGNLTVKTNRFQRERDGLLIDPAFMSIADFRKTDIIKPSKTGDAENYVLLSECTMRVDNEGAHGVVADLTAA